MMHSLRTPLFALAMAPMATTLALAGCASAPPAAHPTMPVAAPNWAAPGAGRMAPIPNPEPKDGREPREPHERPLHSAPIEHPAPAPAVPPTPARAAPPAQSQGSNAARAAHLRAAGLEQMNRGAIDKAVNLLQQAATLDPGNALIRRDLERAIRISHAVHVKK